MTMDDRTYFGRRAEQAREASERASDPRAKQAHRDMAHLFEDRSRGGTAPAVAAAE